MKKMLIDLDLSEHDVVSGCLGSCLCPENKMKYLELVNGLSDFHFRDRTLVEDEKWCEEECCSSQRAYGYHYKSLNRKIVFGKCDRVLYCIIL